MNLTNLKIGARLGLGFGILLALMAVLFAVNLVQLRASAELNQQAQENQRIAATVAQWIASTELNYSRTVAIVKATGSPQVEAYFSPLMKETSAQISTLQQSLEAEIRTDRARALMGEVAALRKDYVEQRKIAIAHQKQGDAAAAEAQLNDRVIPVAQRYLAAMRAVLDYENGLVQDEARQVEQALDRAQLVSSVLLLVGLIFGGLTARWMARSVTVPLRDATAATQAIADGDLRRIPDTTRQDEVGQLLRSLGRMQDSLASLVGDVRGSSDSIRNASTEIASGNADLSSRTEQTASNLQQAASSMEQLTGTVRQTAESARTANQLASSAAEVASRGGEVVQQVVATMGEISQASRKIADIIGTIDSIAFQTNILALNAAVEAARAGEQGRGFAVVAAEVRSLASRSAEAAKQIKGLIGASVEKVESGSRLVGDAGATMAEIVASVQRVNDMIGEITAAATEQSEGIGQINASVTQLDQMTQQNAALVEQSAAAAESLKDQAARLAQALQRFRVDGVSSAPLATVAAAAPRPAATPRIAAPRASAPNASARAATPAPAPAAASVSDDWTTF